MVRTGGRKASHEGLSNMYSILKSPRSKEKVSLEWKKGCKASRSEMKVGSGLCGEGGKAIWHIDMKMKKGEKVYRVNKDWTYPYLQG